MTILRRRRPTPAHVLELAQDGCSCAQISCRLGMPIHDVRRIVREDGERARARFTTPPLEPR